MEKATRRLTLSAMFLALGLVLPFLTGQVPQIGNMLLPMHLPVFLCGLLCGWQYGAAVGFALPLLRSSLFALPVMFPAATAMAFELMTYGLVAGLLYSRSRWQCLRALYRCLLGVWCKASNWASAAAASPWRCSWRGPSSTPSPASFFNWF